MRNRSLFWPFFLIAAGIISLWAASGVIKSLIEGFQAAYRVPRDRGFLSQSGVAVSLVLLSAMPLICASLLIVFGGQVERAVLHWMKVDPFLTPYAWLWQVLSRLTRYVLAFLTTIGIFLGPVIHRFLQRFHRGAFELAVELQRLSWPVVGGQLQPCRMPPARQPVQQLQVRKHQPFLPIAAAGVRLRQPLNEFPIARRKQLLLMRRPRRQLDNLAERPHLLARARAQQV